MTIRHSLTIAAVLGVTVLAGCAGNKPIGAPDRSRDFLARHSSFGELEDLQQRHEEGLRLRPRSGAEREMIGQNECERQRMLQEFEAARREFARHLAEQRRRAERDRQRAGLPR